MEPVAAPYGPPARLPPVDSAGWSPTRMSSSSIRSPRPDRSGAKHPAIGRRLGSPAIGRTKQRELLRRERSNRAHLGIARTRSGVLRSVRLPSRLRVRSPRTVAVPVEAAVVLRPAPPGVSAPSAATPSRLERHRDRSRRPAFAVSPMNEPCPFPRFSPIGRTSATESVRGSRFGSSADRSRRGFSSASASRTAEVSRPPTKPTSVRRFGDASRS